MSNICFFVTEISGIMGKNPYQRQDEEINHLTDRILNNNRKKEIDIPKRYSKMIHKYINETDIQKVQEKIKNIKDLKCPDDIKEGIKKKIYTERGKLFEDIAIEEYQKEIDAHIQTPKEFIKRFYIKNNIPFYIGGKIDGFIINNLGDTIVIEVKNRQNCIFEEIPMYEKIQIECYLRMMRSNECILIQRYDNKNNISTYNLNDSLWDEILLSLSEIAKNLHAKQIN